jgi:uncharacterized protein
MPDQPKYQQFVEYVVKMLVDHPDDVRTEHTVDDRGVLITLHINPADMGQIIGRQGQTARSIRTLLRVVGAQGDARVNMKLYETDEQRQAHLASRPARPDDGASRDDRGPVETVREPLPVQTPMDDLEV